MHKFDIGSEEFLVSRKNNTDNYAAIGPGSKKRDLKLFDVSNKNNDSKKAPGTSDRIRANNVLQYTPKNNLRSERSSGYSFNDNSIADSGAYTKEKSTERTSVSSASRIKKRSASESPNNMKRLLILLITTLSLVIGCIIIYRIMVVNTVEIIGVKKIPTDYCIRQCSELFGNSVLELKEETIRQQIESDLRIEYISTEYRFPDRIIITVEEHLPACCFFLNNKYIVIDDEGRVLEESAVLPSVPIINGISANNFQFGNRIITNNEAALNSLCNLLSVFNKYDITGDIRDIDMRNSNSISYRLNEEITVKLGSEADIDKKVYFAMKVYERLKENGKSSGTIDVCYTSQAIFTEKQKNSADTNNKINYKLGEFNYKAAH